MNADDLRALQAPLKTRYKDAPAAALITLTAEGNLDDQEIACSVETGKALVKAGLHPATGGDGSFACSGDMLLQALAACAGVTLKAVATALASTSSPARCAARAIWISEARSASTRGRRLDSAPSALPSISTPTRTRPRSPS